MMEVRHIVNAFLAGFLLSLGFCYSDRAPNYTFMHEAISAPPIMYFDYIVIGGGTSGCPLAATLSQGANVLLLERGGSPYGNPNITNMAKFATSITDNSPESPAQQFTSQDGVYNVRARVLGGGSALNAGFYTRASPAYMRRVGWDEALVNQSYEWVENKVAFEPPMLQWQSAVRDGLLEVGVSPYNGFTYDHQYGTKFGGSIFDKDGHRHTAADLLEYADPTSIAVYLHATVHRILFATNRRSRPRAYGVIFQDAMGVRHTAYLTRNSRNEIIVSAGALGSPQLLMLSGIGPATQLSAHGLNVVVNNPMVGQGMADNPMNAIFIPSPVPVETSLIQVVGITTSDSYIEGASGAPSVYSWVGRFLTGSIQLDNPDEVQPGFEAEKIGPVTPSISGNLTGGLLLEKVMGPISTGHLELITTDPDDNPSVTFNYFSEPEDLRRCVEGMTTIINVINSRAFSKFRVDTMPVETLINLMVTSPVNMRPRHFTATTSLEQFCIDTVMTIWHYHGGCQVGRVVDNDYRVLSVEGLRVIDGSTFYHSPGTNPQATVMMLGRYMGQRILHERLS